MSILTSFVRPSAPTGIPEHKIFLNDFCALGRTYILRDALHPTQNSIQRQLQAIFAKAFSKMGSAEAPSQIQSLLLEELSLVHPYAREMYEAAVQTSSTFENLKTFLSDSFRTTKETAQSLEIRISEDLKSNDAPQIISFSFMDKKKVERFLNSITKDQDPSQLEIPEVLKKIPGLFEKYESILKSPPSAEKILEKAQELLDSLGEDIDPTPIKRKAIERSLKKIWENLQKERSEQIYTLAEKELIELGLPKITKLYLNDLSTAKTQDHVDKKLASYIKDISSSQLPSGISALSEGVQGFPKIIHWNRNQPVKGFMKHFDSPLELEYHKIYSFFLPILFQDENLNFSPKTATASMISLKDSTYSSSWEPGEQTISSEKMDYIRYLTSFISTSTTPRDLSINEEASFQDSMQTKPLGFFDYIEGKGFMESFKNCDSSDPKIQDLFTRLGSIAFLDLILGNSDRLLQIDPANPSLENTTTLNSGNLMVSPDKKSLYAIDNGIGDGKNTPQSTEQKTAYLTFLKDLISKEDFETKVAQKLLSLLKESLGAEENRNDDFIAELEMEENEVEDEFRPLTCSLRTGIEYIKQQLLEIGIQSWDISELKSTLPTDLQFTIQERLDVLKQLMK